MMKQRLFIILTALVAVVTTARAETTYGITLCGMAVTDGNKDNLTARLREMGYSVNSSSSASYNPTTKTLTVSDFGCSYEYTTLSVEESFTGTLTLQVSGTSSFQRIWLTGTNNLTIQGSGTLTMRDTYGFEISGQHTVTINNADVRISGKWGRTDSTGRLHLVVNGGGLYVGEMRFDFTSVSLTDCVMTEPGGSEPTRFVTGQSVRISPEDRSDPNISWSATSVTINKDQSYTLPSFRNPNSLTDITFSSSNTSVASVNSSGAILLGSGTGTAVITATFNGNGTYKPAQVTTTLTTYKGGKLERTIYWSESEVTAIKGESFTPPALTVSPNPGSSYISYRSSDPTVASVNSSTGEVTINGIGNATITASVNATGSYNACSASYDINVYGYYNISWRVDTYSAAVGQSQVMPGKSGSFSDATYYSSDTDVAEVDENGYVTAKSVGTAVITAERKGEGYYLTTTASYTLMVDNFCWTEPVVYIAVGRSFTPVLVNPTGVELRISSTEKKVATYDTETGIVTAVKKGRCYINADLNNKTLARLTLYVVEAGDANHDLSRNKFDVTALGQMIVNGGNDTVAPYLPEDINGDGLVNILDLTALIELLKTQ